MSLMQLIDSHWNDVLGLACILLSIPCYLYVNSEFAALIAGAGVGVIKGDRAKRKSDAGN